MAAEAGVARRTVNYVVRRFLGNFLAGKLAQDDGNERVHAGLGNRAVGSVLVPRNLIIVAFTPTAAPGVNSRTCAAALLRGAERIGLLWSGD